jgi:hypothetical protein
MCWSTQAREIECCRNWRWPELNHQALLVCCEAVLCRLHKAEKYGVGAGVERRLRPKACQYFFILANRESDGCTLGHQPCRARDPRGHPFTMGPAPRQSTLGAGTILTGVVAILVFEKEVVFSPALCVRSTTTRSPSVCRPVLGRPYPLAHRGCKSLTWMLEGGDFDRPILLVLCSRISQQQELGVVQTAVCIHDTQSYNAPSLFKFYIQQRQQGWSSVTRHGQFVPWVNYCGRLCATGRRTTGRMDSRRGQHYYVLLAKSSRYAYFTSGCPVDISNTTDETIAGVIRDTLYIDGGYLWWNPGLSDGSYAGPTADGMQVLQWQLCQN